MPKITMQVIADKLNITKVSVSKGLNNQPGISDELRSKILATAKEVGYEGTKRFSSKNASYKFAYVVAKRFFLETDKFYNVINYYLNKKCMTQGHQLYSFIVEPDNEKNSVLSNNIINSNFDGIFLLGEISADYIHKLKELTIPLIAIDFYNPSLNIDCVVPDNYNLAFYLTSYLVLNGHQKIGFVGDSSMTGNILDRFLGYTKGLKHFNLPEHSDWSIVNNDYAGMYFSNIVLPKEMPTAFICHCDRAAYYLIQNLNQCGYCVPEDVSIVSFDNTELSTTAMQISTIDIDKKELAYRSLDLMIKRITTPEYPTQRLFLNNRLIERDSVKKIN